MTDISPYIKQLLYRNDCIIIPHFGGIMAQYASAQIHPIQNIFNPPYKSLAFNKSLLHNDGLLINEIVHYTGVSYDAATICIHQYVRKLENDLSSKGQAVINGVGKFFYDIEHNLLFESSEENNYLTNAFGFDRFVVKPVMRHEEVVHQFVNQNIKKKRRNHVAWAGFGVLLTLIVIGLQIINVSNDFKPFHIDKTNLWNSITSNSKPDKKTDAPKIVVDAPPTHRKDTLVQIIVYQQPNENLTSVNSVTTIPTPIATTNSLSTINDTQTIPENFESVKPSIANAISYAVSSIQKNKIKFFVVFACLKSQKRTDLFINQMKQKGIDVSVFMQDSYFRVGIGSFNSSDEAVDSMQQYRSQGIDDVWVLKI